MRFGPFGTIMYWGVGASFLPRHPRVSPLHRKTTSGEFSCAETASPKTRPTALTDVPPRARVFPVFVLLRPHEGRA
jgi:hypothetical protein